MIVRNIAECRLCGDVIESKHRHDFVTCKCGEIFTDGGTAYIRRGATDLGNIIDRSVAEKEKGALRPPKSPPLGTHYTDTED